MTVKSFPFSETGRPITRASAPKSFRQSLSDRTTTGAALVESSPFENPRPICIRTPSRSKNRAPTDAELRRFGSAPAMLRFALLRSWICAMPTKLCV